MGLWAPYLPKEHGGMGMHFLEFATVSEILGASPLGHYTFNCQAPDIGNIELLTIFGSDTQKENYLKPYAIRSINSLGRIYKEKQNLIRSPYQRDRDRIIHSSSFRRLKHKTQVFVNTEGDHYRTRLTHSMEVSQIARTLARSLGLNEDLSETLSLSHDLGHAPFGHAGEEILSQCMRKYGGFDLQVEEKRPKKHRNDALYQCLYLGGQQMRVLPCSSNCLCGPQHTGSARRLPRARQGILLHGLAGSGHSFFYFEIYVTDIGIVLVHCIWFIGS